MGVFTHPADKHTLTFWLLTQDVVANACIDYQESEGACGYASHRQTIRPDAS